MTGIIIPLPLVALAAMAAAFGGMRLARSFDNVTLPRWANPLVALLTVTTVLISGSALSADLVLWSVLLLVPLIALAAIDAATHQLPDSLSLALVLLGLCRIALAGGDWEIPAALAAALVATGLIVDRFAPQASVGAGDFLLAGAAVAWIGPGPVPELAIVASLLLWVHFLCLAALRITGRLPPATGLPLAPALALALALLWFAAPGT